MSLKKIIEENQERVESLANKSKKSKKDTVSKMLSDFLPIVVFMIVYKTSDAENPILPATMWLIIVTFVTLLISYFLTKKISKMPLITAVVLGIFGGLTLFSGNDYFIKIKPTLVNLVFAGILFFGYFTKRPLISFLFGGELKLKDEVWHILALRWGCFFICLAILNEVIWRNFSLDFWVNFKLFGVLPLSMIFTMAQIPLIMKNIKK